MQRDIIKFLQDRKDGFNVYNKAIIDDGSVIVRPCASNDIERANINKKHFDDINSIILIVQSFSIDTLGFIKVIKKEKTQLFFSQIECNYPDKEKIKVNTKVLEFFRKNCFVNELYISNDYLIDDEQYSIFEKNNNSNYNLVIHRWNKENGLILTAGPSITPLETCYAQDAARNGWNSQWNKYLNKFEEKFAEYVGSSFAIATSSCTGALQISLMTLGIGEGDEVLVPDLTWVASATAIRDTGAKPVFVDVELDSWNIDAKKLENKITSKTKAIVVVHMYGSSARMDQIMKFAKKKNLYVVEDAAPAIGAKWNGKSCGTFGNFGCYSFQGAKLLVTGEGGMLVTDDEDLYKKAKKIWDQGRNPNKTFWIDEIGVKFKMSNVQAAIGLGQIERADENISMKRRIFSRYEKNLKSVKNIILNKEVTNSKSIYWMTSLRLLETNRIDQINLISTLKEMNIDTRPVFPAISQYPIWGETVQPEQNAKLIGSTSINLPSGVGLSNTQIDYICDKIISVV